MFSITHIAIVFLIALIVFGPEKLPEVARMLGKVMSDFRRASTDFRRVIEDEFAEIERQNRAKQEEERQKLLAAPTASPVPEGESQLPADAAATSAHEKTIARTEMRSSALSSAPEKHPTASEPASFAAPADGAPESSASPADGRPS